MGVATATTEASMSAIQERLDQLNVMLGRIAIRQNQMLVDLKKRTAALSPTATTMPGRVLEHQTTKLSLPSTISTNRAVAAAALHADAVLAPFAPTRCSTVGLAVNVGNNHAIVSFPTSGMKHLRATTSATAWNNALQGVVGSGVNMSSGCSTHVPSRSPEDPGTRALKIDTHIPDEVLTHVGGFSLFKELNLDTHMEFEESVVTAEEDVNLIWVTPSRWKMVFSVTPPCEQTALTLGKPGFEGAHSLFDKAPPWNNNVFHPENFAARVDHLLLNKIPSWQRSAFSPWNSEIEGADYVFVQAPPWGTNVIQPRFFATQGKVLNQMPPLGRTDFSPGNKRMERVRSVFELLPSWRYGGFSPGIKYAKSEYLRHCFSREHFYVHWHLDGLQYIRCGTSNCKAGSRICISWYMEFLPATASTDSVILETMCAYQRTEKNVPMQQLFCSHRWTKGYPEEFMVAVSRLDIYNSSEKNGMSWHLQVQEEPCKCSILYSFFGMSTGLEYKQWDPGISHKWFECFLEPDQ